MKEYWTVLIYGSLRARVLIELYDRTAIRWKELTGVNNIITEGICREHLRKIFSGVSLHQSWWC